jgi:hypothetical protein
MGIGLVTVLANLCGFRAGVKVTVNRLTEMFECVRLHQHLFSPTLDRALYTAIFSGELALSPACLGWSDLPLAAP